MSDEDALLRAVVADPSDTLARLVYADWLDDRGDPRGAYLRLEREAIRTGDVPRLLVAAAGLDPVWVARVGLPLTCMVPVAFTQHDLGYFMLGVADHNRGRVFHFTNYCHNVNEADHLHEYSPTFAALLSRLRPDKNS